MIRQSSKTTSKRSFWDIQMHQESPSILAECNSIKYAAYRMAAKLRILQRILCLENVRLGLMANVFDRHHLHRSENDVDLEHSELEAVLYDIFFAAEKESQCSNNIDACTATMVQFLLDIYDNKSQNNTVSVINAKVCLAVLSSSKLQEKYQYFFYQYSDHNNCIAKKKFVSFLKTITQITEFLSETSSFGNLLIPATVDNCFKNSLGPLGLAEHSFINWLVQEPQLLVWLSTFYRLQSAEAVYHDAKCSVCKMYPIKGLRYHCLRCLAYDQCQGCFFKGKLSKRHKLLHPMEEHCSQSSSKDNALTFFKILKNKLCRTKTSTKLHYLPVQAFESEVPNKSDEHFTPTCGKDVPGADSELCSLTIIEGMPAPRNIQPYTELQSIICHLEQDNRLLNDNIGTLLTKNEVSCVSKYLQDHRALVETQVKRLKQLKHHLLQLYPPHEPCLRLREPLESTPVLPAHRTGCRPALGLDEISPIMRQLDETRVSLEQKTLSAAAARRVPIEQESELPSLSEVSAGDISSWVGQGAVSKGARVGVTESGAVAAWTQESQPKDETTIKELHEDLDQILDRLQKMLTSNFSLEESFSGRDNTQLQITTAEIEDLLSGLVEGVAKSKSISSRDTSTEK